jgi:chromate transport protein ChrA
MSEDQLKRRLGAHAALAFLLLPGLCALPLLALITPAPARFLFLGVWALLALALAAVVAQALLRMRRAALRRRREATDGSDEP